MLPGRSELVVLNESIRHFDDFSGAAVVLRQLYELHVILAPERLQPLRTRAVPLVDDLVVVSDDEQVRLARWDEELQELELRLVRVLELVDADMRPSEAQHASYAGILAQ